MNLEERIALAKGLIQKRDEIDQQLGELFGGGTPRKQKCSVCGSVEHTARTCPQKSEAQQQPKPSAAVSPAPFDARSYFVENDQR